MVETSREKIIRALIEHSRKMKKPLTEGDIVKGISALYLKMGEGVFNRYKENVPLLAEDIHAALKASERSGGLRPILVHGQIKMVPAGRKVTTEAKPIQFLVKKRKSLFR